MALLPFPSSLSPSPSPSPFPFPFPGFFSLLVLGKPLANRWQANFHPKQLLGKPRPICQLARYHRLVVCRYSSPDPSIAKSTKKPLVVPVQSDYQLPTSEDHFIDSLSKSHMAFDKIRIEKLKEEVKKLFIYANDPLQKMNLVYAIERLGLAYHFDKEIHLSLQQVYNDNEDFDVFEKFENNEGSFKQSLGDDVWGLLSLYEASYCSIHGEDILDNALMFTRQELNSMASHLDPTLSRFVRRSLEFPPQRGLPRLEVRHFISFYEDDESRNDVLLELAKMNFNQLQSTHRSEINEVFRWWKELDLGENLHYIGDRNIIDCYMWAMEINYLPEFSNGRIALAKLANLTVLTDDTYDTYGTFEEMELFTDAIERWDIRAMDQLPESLGQLCLAFYNFANDIKYLCMKHQENNAIYYVKKTVQDYCRASIEEARWFKDGYTPSLDEYMRISLITAAGYMVYPVAALGMGDMVDKEGLHYIAGNPKLPRLANSITRLMDDIATSKVEQDRAASSIKCYMKENGVSREEAFMHIKNLVAKAWKDINQEILNPIPLPKPLVNGIVNFGKLGEIFYLIENDADLQCSIRDHIHSMLFEPIPI